MNRISKTSVRKAGSTIRAYYRGQATEEQREQALEIIDQYRYEHVEGLLKLHNLLIEISSQTTDVIQLFRRLKRVATIEEKLLRESGLDLSRMRDIGGLRLVTPTKDNTESLYWLANQIIKQLDPENTKLIDYIKTPRRSGYRALHIETMLDGYRYEIQIRNRPMHEWAQTVEQYSTETGYNYKHDGHKQFRIDTHEERRQ